MATSTERRASIVVEKMQIAGEAAPKDAVPVESIQIEDEAGEWKNILAMWQKANGKQVKIRLLIKLWVEQIAEEEAPEKAEP